MYINVGSKILYHKMLHVHQMWIVKGSLTIGWFMEEIPQRHPLFQTIQRCIKVLAILCFDNMLIPLERYF